MKHKFLVFIALIFSNIIIAQNDFVLAENYYRTNEFEKAIQLYQKLVAKSPYNTAYLKRLIACYQETNQFDTVETLLLSKKKKNPRITFFDVMLGYNHERKQQIDEAKTFYEKAINSIDRNPAYAGVIANLFKGYNQLDYAIKAYEKAELKNPKANYGFPKAQIYGEKGDFEKMFTSYIELVDKNESYINTVQRYTARYITDDSENETNKAFKKALLRRSISNPKNIWNELLSWLFAQQKEYSKAFIQEKALFTRNGENIDQIEELGAIAFKEKDYNAARQCFLFVIESEFNNTNKINAELYLLKIKIEENEDEIDTAFDEVFKKYGKNASTIPIQIAYADYLTFKESNPELAKTILEKASKLSTSRFQKARIKLKLGDIAVFTSKYNKALLYFSQVQTQFKNHPLSQEARLKVAQTSYYKGDFEWAKAQLKVLKGSTTQLIANDAVDLYLTITDNEPVDSIPSGLKEYAKADLLAYQNKNKDALKLLDTVIQNYKGQPIEDEAYFKKAQLLIKEENISEGVDNYLKVITINNESILVDDVLFSLAETYSKINDIEKAKEYYQKIIFEHPSSIYLVDARKKFRKLRGDSI